MADKIMINDETLDAVNGGSIIFNEDLTTCGRNCNNQYYVLNMDEVSKYIDKNKTSMCERDMLKNMVAAGYLKKIEA